MDVSYMQANAQCIGRDTISSQYQQVPQHHSYTPLPQNVPCVDATQAQDPSYMSDNMELHTNAMDSMDSLGELHCSGHQYIDDPPVVNPVVVVPLDPDSMYYPVPYIQTPCLPPQQTADTTYYQHSVKTCMSAPGITYYNPPGTPCSSTADITYYQPLVTPSSSALDITYYQPLVTPSSSAPDITYYQPLVTPSSSAPDITYYQPPVTPCRSASDITYYQPPITPQRPAADITRYQPPGTPCKLAPDLTNYPPLDTPYTSTSDLTCALVQYAPSHPASGVIYHSAPEAAFPQTPTTPCRPLMPFTATLPVSQIGVESQTMADAQPASFPQVHVTPAGLLTVALRCNIAVEMTLDRTIRLVNHTSNAVVATDSRGTASCIHHREAKIYQQKTSTSASLLLDRQIKMTTGNIYFGTGGQTYHMSSTSLTLKNICYPDLSKDMSVSLLYSSSGYGPALIPQLCEVAAAASYKFHQRGGITVRINGMKIFQSSRGDVMVYCGPKFLKSSPLTNTVSLHTHFVEMGVECYRGHRRVRIRRGDQMALASPETFMVSNSHHEAGIDLKGNVFHQPVVVIRQTLIDKQGNDTYNGYTQGPLSLRGWHAIRGRSSSVPPQRYQNAQMSSTEWHATKERSYSVPPQHYPTTSYRKAGAILLPNVQYPPPNMQDQHPTLQHQQKTIRHQLRNRLYQQPYQHPNRKLQQSSEQYEYDQSNVQYGYGQSDVQFEYGCTPEMQFTYEQSNRLFESDQSHVQLEKADVQLDAFVSDFTSSLIYSCSQEDMTDDAADRPNLAVSTGPAKPCNSWGSLVSCDNELQLSHSAPTVAISRSLDMVSSSPKTPKRYRTYTKLDNCAYKNTINYNQRGERLTMLCHSMSVTNTSVRGEKKRRNKKVLRKQIREKQQVVTLDNLREKLQMGDGIDMGSLEAHAHLTDVTDVTEHNGVKATPDKSEELFHKMRELLSRAKDDAPSSPEGIS